MAENVLEIDDARFESEPERRTVIRMGVVQKRNLPAIRQKRSFGK